MYKLTTGIGAGRGGLDPEKTKAALQAADDGGVHSVWTGEAWGPDAITMLALAAAWTKRVQIGSAIVNVYSRTPAALAQHFATLDVVSGGRMILGLGTSGAQVVEHFHGVPFGRGLRRLREYIDIINMLIAGTPLNYEGEIFQMSRGFTLRFQTQRTHIPIYIASLNPASVRMTARHADGWLPIWIPVDRLGQEIAALRATAVEAGRKPEDVTVRSPGAITITKDVEQARQAVRGTRWRTRCRWRRTRSRRRASGWPSSRPPAWTCTRSTSRRRRRRSKPASTRRWRGSPQRVPLRRGAACRALVNDRSRAPEVSTAGSAPTSDHEGVWIVQ
jgi:alkanesulfonate monooxygenase SsuD/methylene tetrahydromethanopterin reductase-like flavin-dependent oxidoreductase (luciferase family)